MKGLCKKNDEKDTERFIEKIEEAEVNGEGEALAREIMEADGLYKEGSGFATEAALDKLKDLDIDS